MAGVNVEYINPFLAAAAHVLQDMCLIEAQVGKPALRSASFAGDSMIIMIGVTGAMGGQVMIAFSNATACDIASKMMHMPVTQMDDLATSAICELGNMILGNAATIFSTKGIGIDITPPAICHGNVSFSTSYAANVCIPLIYEENKIVEINVSIKGDK